MSDLKRISHSLILKTVSLTVVSLCGLLVSVVLNHYYGKIEYGFLVMVYTVSSFFISIGDPGIKASYKRFIPIITKSGEPKVGKYSIVPSGMILQLVWAFILAIMMFFISDTIANNIFHNQRLGYLLKVGTLFFVGYTLVDFMVALFQAYEDWKSELIVNSVYALCSLIFLALLIYLSKPGLDLVLLTNFAAAILAVIVGMKLLKQRLKDILKIDWGLFKRDLFTIVTFGTPLMSDIFIFYLFTWLDKWLLGSFRTPAELSVYYIAFILHNNFLNIYKVIYFVMMPYSASLTLKTYEENKVKFALFFRWIMHSSILLCIVLFYAIQPFVNLFYGSAYSDIIKIFRLLLLGFFLRAITIPAGIYLINFFGKVKYYFFTSLISVPVYVLSTFMLIPRYGIMGAIGSFIFITAFGLSFEVLYPKIRVLLPMVSVYKTLGVLLLTIGAGFYLQTLKVNLIISAILLLSFYIFMMVMLSEFKASDYVLAKKIISSNFNKNLFTYDFWFKVNM